jgi:outer membrane receptor protein involved in Fe transport
LDGGAKLDIKFGLSYNSNENDFRGRSFNARDQQNFDRTNNSRSTDDGVTFNGKYSTPAIEGHALVVGWDFGYNEREQTNRTRDVLFANVTPFIPPFNIDEDSTAKVTRLAAFAQDEWNVTKQWSVYLGARWEGLTTKSEGNTYQSITNRSSVFSPIAQTLYKLPSRPGEQVRLALTRTYKAPNTFDLIPRLFTSVENKPTSPDSRGNPDLKPELATGIDVAYEKFWGQGASMSLSANMRQITDYNRRGLLFINDRWVSLPINDGKANTRSIEFDTKFPWQLFWKAAPPVDFRFNAARNWSSVDSVPGPNNRLAQQVPYNATLGLDYRMKNGVLVAGGSFTIRGGGLVRTSTTQSTYLSTKRDLDMYALWKITPKLQARLTLSNILKPAAINENTYFDANGSTNTRTNTPSKMNIRAGIEWKF